MKSKHFTIIFFKKIAWYITGVYEAIYFHQRIKNYNFLIDTLHALEIKLLSLKRIEQESEEIIKIEAQIYLLKKILSYVNKR